MPAGRPLRIEASELRELAALHIASGGNLSGLALAAGLTARAIRKRRAADPELDFILTNTKPATCPVVIRSIPLPVISLAAWGIPRRTTSPEFTPMTDEEVDDMLWEAAA